MVNIVVLSVIHLHCIVNFAKIKIDNYGMEVGCCIMGGYLNPPNDGFAESLASEIYVDKSEMIAYINKLLGTRQKFICISRPRRFGKSMAAEMLAAYYCCTCNSRELFQNLKIAQDSSYEKHLNQYDVLFLNVQQILSEAGDAAQAVNYLQKMVLAELQREYGQYIPAEVNNLPAALTQIFLSTKKKFVFIIDEWDCIFREKKMDTTLQVQYLDFLRNLLKDRAYVNLAYMTGILPIKKYGTHSALNMFDEYSMTDARRLSEYVGFTEDEVKTLCETYEMDFEETKRWYDGYYLKNGMHIYNPKSVVDAMRNQEFNSYWVNTETYEALKVYIDMNYDGLKDAIVQMLGGSRCQIDTRRFTNDMTTFASKDDVLTLLVHLGYLAYDNKRKEVFIPNEEIRAEFVTAIEGSGWQEVIRSISASRELLEKTWCLDEKAVAAGLDAVHMDTTSILNYHNENALSCVISLAYYSARDEYCLIRELPTGKGFADVVFVPYRFSSRPALIVELKWDQSAEGAIAQIKEKQYVKALEDYTGEILLVGVNYDKESKKHQCMIERYMK